jgi:class 3 adenylate cyclase/tetratricopeptide (TPR) repeat protein
MQCPRCREQNPEQSKFCRGCGARLESVCARCQHRNLLDSRFCNQCGAPLADEIARPAPEPSPLEPRRPYTPKHLAQKILGSRAALEGERRQVTVLFADIADYTRLAEGRDPEDVHQIMDRCFALITAEVHRFEGTINQYTGDGVMALFGAPIAHEDASRRAVHAALGIQRAIRDLGSELQARYGLALQMRIGLNTGPVVVGKIGDDLRMDYTAVGDTTNLAARIQQAARPGSVLISETTHRSIAGFFETLPLGEIAIKGHDPVAAFEVLRARGRRARLDIAVERGLTPLVGRDRELDALMELVSHVRSGHGRVVSIVGEAGIGKSRLVLEFRRRQAAAGHDTTWIEGRCVSFGSSIPFLPVIDQLRQSFGIEEFDGEPEIIAKVEHHMRRMGGLDAQIPYIRYLLAVDPGDPSITAMDAHLRRKRVLDAARALALRGAALRPIVFVVEDLHWIDTSSEEYIGSLVDSIAAVPIMLVLTYRVGYTPRFGTRSFHTTLTLSALSDTEAATMAGRVLGADHFPEELRAALTMKAEGVPLFVEEVTKTLLDLGVLHRDNGGYRMVKTLAEVGVPDTIQGIIMARLDQLGDDGKRAVQLASVIGRQFLHRLLERIAGLTGRLDGVLAELKALEIIYEAGLLPEPAYVFKHAVIQDVAYQSLLVQKRKELHRAVGLAIEELYADRLPEHYGELAHHFAHGDDWNKTMEYAALAGDRAADALANVEAAAHYARALDAAGRLTPAPDALAVASLHSRKAAVLLILGRYEECVAEYERALAIAREVGDAAVETAVLIALGDACNLYHRTEESLRRLDEALRIARRTGDRASQALCLTTMALTRYACGQITPDEPLELGTALASARDLDDRRRALALAYTAIIHEWRGEYDEAMPHLREAMALADASHSGFAQGMAAYAVGHVALARGEYEQALSAYGRIRDYARMAGDVFSITRSPNCLGGVHLEVFDFDEALRLGIEGDELCQAKTPWPEPRAHSLLKIGLVHLACGRFGQADEVFGRMEGLLDRDKWGRWRWHIPLLRARGELALATGQREPALAYALQSLALARQTRSLKHVARAQRLQGEVLLASDRLVEALDVLGASVALADRLGTARESWMGESALGRVFARLGRDEDAASSYAKAAQTLDAIAGKLVTPRLRASFVAAEPVVEVYHALGRRPPQ